MTRAEHKRLASEILAAVGEIAESHGYVASQGAGRYDPDGGGTFKLELALIAEDGSIVTKERLDYIANAEAHWSDMAPAIIFSATPFLSVGLQRMRLCISAHVIGCQSQVGRLLSTPFGRTVVSLVTMDI